MASMAPVNDAPYPTHKKVFWYFFLPINMVDFFTVFPFLVRICHPHGNFERRFYILRILRLSQALKGFRIGEKIGNVSVLLQTVKHSLPALSILSFFAIIGIVLFASILFYFESGNYIVTDEFPGGAYVRSNSFTGHVEETPFGSIVIAMYWAVTVRNHSNTHTFIIHIIILPYCTTVVYKVSYIQSSYYTVLHLRCILSHDSRCCLN
jgi:hypothetical protein